MERKRIIAMILIVILFIIAIILSFLYYKDKYKVSFETGTNEIIITKYVDKNSTVSEPVKPYRKGFIFVEWQLNGETYDFNSKITNDIVLSAKWAKEDYVTINYNTNSEINIKSYKIIKGNIIDKLPEVNKNGFEFKGWYLNDKLYNNEEINSDTTLVAQYKNNKIDTTYKIGDKVIIIDKYAKTSMSIYSYNKMAIGWEREILDINDSYENPYVIGNSDGITGYFKASSIQVIE